MRGAVMAQAQGPRGADATVATADLHERLGWLAREAADAEVRGWAVWRSRRRVATRSTGGYRASWSWARLQ